MPKLILDKFTTMGISRQRRYQLRKQQAGCCKICGKPAKRYVDGEEVEELLCVEHREQAITHMRERREAPRPGRPRKTRVVSVLDLI